MIDADLAGRLRTAGLTWRPASGDRFTIPGGELADEVFVIADMVIQVQDVPGGSSVLKFNGTTEWAQFLVPAHLYDVARGVKTPRTLSDEQRAVLAERARLFFGAERAKVAALDADQGDGGTSGTPEGDIPSDHDTDALLEPLDGGEWDDLL